MKKIIWVLVIIYCNRYKNLIINFSNPILKIDDRISLHFLNHNYKIYSPNNNISNDAPIYFFNRDEAESIAIMLKLTSENNYQVYKMEVEEGLEDDRQYWKICDEN